MRRRLYFLIPTIKDTSVLFDHLLLRRVPINNMCVIAKEGTGLEDLPEASAFQKYDIIHSMLVGVGLGAIIGIIAGIIGHYLLGFGLGGVMIATTLIGAILGGWSASMIGMMVPNSRHDRFHEAIEKGQILLMVDVPKERVKEIELFVQEKLPEASYQGIEPTIPSFP